jgi:replication-associated recombination protein RarA
VQNRQVPLEVFVGRAAELARMAEVISRVQAGQPWLVAIEGDPGVGKTALARLSNPEIAADLFISRKAVEYHLGNIYAKCGLEGRQQLRRFVAQWRQPTAV